MFSPLLMLGILMEENFLDGSSKEVMCIAWRVMRIIPKKNVKIPKSSLWKKWAGIRFDNLLHEITTFHGSFINNDIHIAMSSQFSKWCHHQIINMEWVQFLNIWKSLWFSPQRNRFCEENVRVFRPDSYDNVALSVLQQLLYYEPGKLDRWF